MSTWSGTFQVVNNTGGAIYSGQVSHTAVGTQGNVSIIIPSTGLPEGGTLGGGIFFVETTTRNFWSWSYLSANGQRCACISEQCALPSGDVPVTVSLTASCGVTILSNSGSCTCHCTITGS